MGLFRRGASPHGNSCHTKEMAAWTPPRVVWPTEQCLCRRHWRGRWGGRSQGCPPPAGFPGSPPLVGPPPSSRLAPALESLASPRFGILDSQVFSLCLSLPPSSGPPFLSVAVPLFAPVLCPVACVSLHLSSPTHPCVSLVVLIPSHLSSRLFPGLTFLSRSVSLPVSLCLPQCFCLSRILSGPVCLSCGVSPSFSSAPCLCRNLPIHLEGTSPALALLPPQAERLVPADPRGLSVLSSPLPCASSWVQGGA